MIESVLKDMLETVCPRVSPAFSTGPFPSITYTLSPISEGPIKTSQLEVRVISNQLDECINFRDQIIKLLHKDEQQPSILAGDYVMRAQVSGGGWLFNSDTQMWEYPTIFIITWRCK